MLSRASRVWLKQVRTSSCGSAAAGVSSLNKPHGLPVTALKALVDRRVPMRSLEQEFYVSEKVFEADLATIWRHSWLFAGYGFEIKNPGDFFTMQVGKDNLIVIRGDDGKVRALYNTCRHRGSKVCLENRGHTKRMVCSYHQWSYARDGKLVHARDMPPNFDKSCNGLPEAHAREFDGLIFVCLQPITEKPHFDWDAGQAKLHSQTKVHGFAKGKVAHSITYIINSNWKLVFENNRECYHCNKGHPEYIAANYDTSFVYYKDENGEVKRRPDPELPRAKEIEEYIAERTKYWSSLGLECTADNQFPGEGWYRASRQPLRKDWDVESIDGKPVSKKLMGSFTTPSMGSMRIHVLPNYWIHASSDHAVSTRLLPVSKDVTEARVDWIVHEDAKEGVDYHLNKLLPFWKITSEQDWQLCSNNQKGVESSAYTPGQFSDDKEVSLDKFIQWYLNNFKALLPKLA